MLQQPFGVFSAAVLRFPKLLVAAVNGPAVGVGVTLLPHCDMVYAYGGAEGGAMNHGAAPGGSSSAGGRRLGVASAGSAGVGAGAGAGGGQAGAASFWTPFFRLAIVPEFCSSVTFPEILVGGVFLCSVLVRLGGWIFVCCEPPDGMLGEAVL